MGGTQSLESQVTCHTWVPLCCPCPAAGCCNGREINHRHFCGEKLYINSQAFIRCPQHGVIGKVADALWNCYKHDGYRKGDEKSIVHSLTVLASLRPKTEKEWCKRLIKSAVEFFRN